MKVITAPQDYIPQPNDVLCFLAGGITNCKEWQEEVIFTLKRIEGLEHLVVFNPRRDNFPMDDPNASEEQIVWEFIWLNRADIFSMYFCRSESDQPICMYELGRNLHKMKTDYPTSYEDRIVVSVEDGYKRECDVKIQTMLAVSLKASVGTNPICHAYEIARCYRNLADRKTEPQTCSVNGRPYDCGNCEYHKCTADEPQTEDWQDWKDRMWAEAIVTEPTTEDSSTVPTSSILEQVDKDINVRSKDEPQTEWHYDEQDATWYPYKHEDEPQTERGE